MSLLVIVFVNLTTSYFFLSSLYYSTSSLFVKSHSQVINKPLCKEGILQRQWKTKESSVLLVDLLTDVEDPNILQRDCRLHHYNYQDVVSCLDQLTLLRQQNNTVHQSLVQFVFIGDSTAREQFDNFRLVNNKSERHFIHSVSHTVA